MTLSLPLGVAVSVLAYGFLDVDRVISATASYALIGLSLLAAALAGLPAAAVQVAATLGVPAEPARFVLGVALLGLLLAIALVAR